MRRLEAFDRIWGERIFQKRKNIGLYRHEVSKKTGLSLKIVAQIEKEPSKVPLRCMASILCFYGLTDEEIVDLGSLPSI